MQLMSSAIWSYEQLRNLIIIIIIKCVNCVYVCCQGVLSTDEAFWQTILIESEMLIFVVDIIIILKKIISLSYVLY